jgi:hypothetical protein
MKLTSTLSLSIAVILSAIAPGFAKPVTTQVAFEATAKGNEGRHITAKPKGGLILGSTFIDNKEIFTLVDLNGGTLKNGDAVQVQYPSGNRPSYWIENKNNIARTADNPTPACTFKVQWKVPDKTLVLRTASGKFVSGPGKGKDMATVAKATDPAIVFALIKNPAKPEKAAPKKAD